MEGKRLRIFGDIWKQMWPAALLLYLSYFFYRWIGVYTAGILGETADILLDNSGEGMVRGIFRDLAAAFLLALLLMPMVDFLTNVLLFRMGLRYEASVVDKVFRKDYETFLAWQSDQWTSRISTDPLQYRQMAVVTPTRLLADITVLLVAFMTLFRIDAVLTVILMAGIGFSILLRFLCRKRDEYFHEKNRGFQDEIKARQTEMVRESAFWASYGCRQSLPEWMGEHFADFYREVRKPEAAMTAGIACVQKGANTAVFLFSLFYGLGQVEKGRMYAGDFISIYFIVTQVRAMAESIVLNLQTLRGYGAQRERIETLVGGSERIEGQKAGRWETLSFKKVSYVYPGTGNGMPEQDFAVKRGEAVKLEGENGYGKTTLLRLLGGLFSGKNGEIWVDGNSLKQTDLATWREQIGYVQQFPDILD